MTVQHCLIALLWSSTDDDGEPLDDGEHEASQQLIDRISADWSSFRSQAEAMGFDPERDLAIALHHDNDGDHWNAAAHDFILTRNGHGCGFWDGRWNDPWGDKLTKLAEQFGEIDAYVGDDGLIYSL
jgi:hypothetical protein